MATYCDLCEQSVDSVYECVKCGFVVGDCCGDNLDTYKDRDIYRASWWICPRCGAEND